MRDPQSAMLRPGGSLGPYEILEPIGRGGMGEVYRARDARLRRHVAIKILPSRTPESRDRFQREARAVAALSHPNIVAIYDVGEHDGIPYAAIELLEGEPLRARIGSLRLRTVLDYAVQIARGLAAAHARGIVHRDLKPENIFVTHDNQVKILDFGLATEAVARAEDETTGFEGTGAGLVLGTVGYMSPEQARGAHADARSDIFSLGCVLYEMATGRRAFAGDSQVETLHAILKEQPPDLASSGRDVPPGLDRLIMRCLEKSPAQRFQTAQDLVFALETLSSGAAPAHEPAPAAGPRSPTPWRIAIAVVALAAVAGVAGIWWGTSRSAPATETVAANVPDDPRRLLAVLPFQQIAREDGRSYFAAGMTEEVASRLSKLSALRVISRSAIAKFKDARADLSAMVEELGVGSVVSGTVREDGSRIRVNVELVDARSRQVIWSDQYDREGVDVFAAQSDIALRVAEALQASVSLEEQARVGKRPTDSVAAYQAFARARGLSRVNRASLIESIDLLKQAVAIDPQFALAFSEMAMDYLFLGLQGDPSAAAAALNAAHRAADLDPELAQAHHVLALSTFQHGRLNESLPMLQKAVALDPSDHGALADYGIVLNAAGRFDEALVWATRALRLTPNQSTAYYHVGLQLLFLDDDARTERFLTRAAARFPKAVRLQILLAFLDLRRGRGEAALARMQRTVEASPNNMEALIGRCEVAVLSGSPDADAFMRPLLPDSAEAPTQLISHRLKLLRAWQQYATGRRAEAGEVLDGILAENRQAVANSADWLVPRVENTTAAAIRGDIPAALDWLEQAYAAGWKDARMTRLMPMWAPLRSRERFERLVARMEADVAAMRTRADYSGLTILPAKD